MIERWKAIGGILKRIGDFDAYNFKDRMLMQKIVYLMQECFDVRLGYTYNWYVHGPYSTSLADDYYKFQTTESVKETEFKSEEVEEKLQSFIDYVKDKKDDIDWLKVASSLVYATNNQNFNRDSAIEWVTGIKKYPNNYVEDIWNELRENNLIEQ